MNKQNRADMAKSLFGCLVFLIGLYIAFTFTTDDKEYHKTWMEKSSNK